MISDGTVVIDKLLIQALDIPFKLSFSHASADRSRTQSVLVTATSREGLTGYGESCPREYVTGESVDSVIAFFHNHKQAAGRISDINSLHAWVVAHRKLIDVDPAAWCAMELAILDLFGKSSQQSVEALLCKPQLSGEFQYSAILGADDPRVFEKLLVIYLDMGFTDFKIKLMGERKRDLEKIELLKMNIDESMRIRFDANNCWADADTAYLYLTELDCPFWAVEEPLIKGDYQALGKLAASLECKIILDESFLRLEQLNELEESAESWLINIRVSKMGGLLRSLELVDAISSRRIPVIVGAQVGETSLLTRAAMTVANYAGDMLLAQEGAYGTYLLEHDICEPVLKFGRGGRLDIGAVSLQDRFGLGLSVIS